MQKQNILIVDDSPVNIKILGATLMDDYEIMVTTSGLEALDIVGSENRPDLILLDIMMPEMDGYEVCRRLKSDPLTEHIPVIFITARSEEKEQTKGFELGAVDYITKPFSPAIVKARVTTHLDLKLHQDRLSKTNNLLKQQLKKQEISIDMSKKLLNLINGLSPRYIELSSGLMIFVDAILIPCHAEGGDHYFIRCVEPDSDHKDGKTVISLKDQSGHEVGCVLRSIMTDMIHRALLDKFGSLPIESAVSMLNDEICRSDMLNREDFFTSINAEIDHETLMLRYVSAGHPPFLLIRSKSVIPLPETGQAGENVPIAIQEGIEFAAGSFQLIPGDKLIFYTDGLTEMPIKNKKDMITIDGLAQIVLDIIDRHEGGYDLSVSEIMQSLLSEIARISMERVSPEDACNRAVNTSSDDITLVCLEIEPLEQYSQHIWYPWNDKDISKLVNNLCKQIEKEWSTQGFDMSRQRLPLVLEEAVLNAWKHGNKKDPEKSITVRWRMGNDFYMEVIDEGEGFDYENQPDPTVHENIAKPSGKGVFIIRHYSTFAKWKDNGRHLMIFLRKNMNSGEEKRIRKIEKMVRLWGMPNRLYWQAGREN
ncbi:response regulator [Desulfobacterales bacterium HSG16]|nr:response regulator [Desulfobacterales bacterium HSG16]